MFRASVMAIVLICAAGPCVPVLCHAWCDPQAAATRGCHHEDARSANSVARSHSCDDAMHVNAVLLKEDVPRASTTGAPNVTAVAHVQFAMAQRSLPVPRHQARAASGLTRPLTTPLRI